MGRDLGCPGNETGKHAAVGGDLQADLAFGAWPDCHPPIGHGPTDFSEIAHIVEKERCTSDAFAIDIDDLDQAMPIGDRRPHLVLECDRRRHGRALAYMLDAIFQ